MQAQTSGAAPGDTRGRAGGRRPQPRAAIWAWPIFFLSWGNMLR